eukprot:scaffold186636_cov25-Tisochrysis_lutea.AAC.1
MLERSVTARIVARFCASASGVVECARELTRRAAPMIAPPTCRSTCASGRWWASCAGGWTRSLAGRHDLFQSAAR